MCSRTILAELQSNLYAQGNFNSLDNVEHQQSEHLIEDIQFDNFRKVRLRLKLVVLWRDAIWIPIAA